MFFKVSLRMNTLNLQQWFPNFFGHAYYSVFFFMYFQNAHKLHMCIIVNSYKPSPKIEMPKGSEP